MRSAAVVKVKSFVDEINKEILKAEYELRKKAATHMRKAIRTTLVNGPSESVPGGVPAKLTGNLIKGVRSRNRKTVSIVGVTAPHAINVEYGHDVIRDGKKIGEAEPRPFVQPTWEKEKDNVIRILSDDWIE